MKIKTKYLGEIEINEEHIIIFEEGIPGFIDLHKYVILNLGDNTPFVTLQSIENSELAFILLSPFNFYPDYEINLEENIQQELGIKSPEDVMLYSIVVIPEDIKQMRANLKAPVVINIKNKKGKQVIIESEKYPVRYYIYEENASLQNTGEAR